MNIIKVHGLEETFFDWWGGAKSLWPEISYSRIGIKGKICRNNLVVCLEKINLGRTWGLQPTLPPVSCAFVEHHDDILEVSMGNILIFIFDCFLGHFVAYCALTYLVSSSVKYSLGQLVR